MSHPHRHEAAASSREKMRRYGHSGGGGSPFMGMSPHKRPAADGEMESYHSHHKQFSAHATGKKGKARHGFKRGGAVKMQQGGAVKKHPSMLDNAPPGLEHVMYDDKGMYRGDEGALHEGGPQGGVFSSANVGAPGHDPAFGAGRLPGGRPIDPNEPGPGTAEFQGPSEKQGGPVHNHKHFHVHNHGKKKAHGGGVGTAGGPRGMTGKKSRIGEGEHIGAEIEGTNKALLGGKKRTSYVNPKVNVAKEAKQAKGGRAKYAKGGRTKQTGPLTINISPPNRGGMGAPPPPSLAPSAGGAPPSPPPMGGAPPMGGMPPGGMPPGGGVNPQALAALQGIMGGAGGGMGGGAGMPPGMPPGAGGAGMPGQRPFKRGGKVNADSPGLTKNMNHWREYSRQNVRANRAHEHGATGASPELHLRTPTRKAHGGGTWHYPISAGEVTGVARKERKKHHP